jgi:basic membrane protein A and related proteins
VSRKRFLPVALAVPAVALVAVLLVGTGSAAHKATVKAGLVSDVGRFNDKGFNQNQLVGLKKSKTLGGVTISAIESRSAGDYIPNFVTLARQHYDVIIGAGFLLADAENTVAKKFPSTHFAITDYSVHAPPFADSKGVVKTTNVTGLTYATQENSYLVGCLAALMTKKDGAKHVISVTAGVKIPPVDSFAAGYRAGAKKCVPGTKVLIAYSQDFIAQDKCKAIALNQIAAGSHVVFNVAGPCGLGALEAAKEQGVWGVGVDVDQAYLGPHILTSAVKRVDQGVYLTVKAAKDGTLVGGGDITFNLKNNGVALGKMSSKVPAAFKAKLNSLRAQIISGKIVPPAAL